MATWMIIDHEDLTPHRHSGNILVITSTTSTILGLTWGGVTYPWSSVYVLAPLLVGLAGLCVFLTYEAKFAHNAVVSYRDCIKGDF
jgi:hypothetical protein